jgi:hypothetical protein
MNTPPSTPTKPECPNAPKRDYSTINFESTLAWIDAELPQCRLTDDLIRDALKDYGLDNNLTVIEQILPLLSPIERPNQTSKDSAIENAKGEPVVTEFNADTHDLFATTTVKSMFKIDLVEKLLQGLPEFWQSENVAAITKLERIDQLIPEACKYKDIIVRRILTQEWQKIEQTKMQPQESTLEKGKLKSIIEQRMGSILDSEVRMFIGYMGLQLEKTLNPDLFEKFDSGRETILRYMPDFSYRRDQVIIDLLNTNKPKNIYIFKKHFNALLDLSDVIQ